MGQNMKRRLFKNLFAAAAGVALTAFCASNAFAGDTTELLDMGTVEVAPTFSLINLQKDVKPAVEFGTVVGYGVTDFMTINVGLAIHSDEALAGLGFDFDTDLLFTPVDTENFDFDVHVNFAMGDTGLVLTPGIELNYDSDNEQSGFGAYFRLDLPISSSRTIADLFNDDDDEDADGIESDVGLDLTLGLYYSIMEGHQLFLEGGVSFANLAENYADREIEGYVSLGYNAVLIENFELVNEVKIIIPEKGDGTNAVISVGGIFDLPLL